ncbi:hypothetical protein CAFEA_09535 [Corynebacterium afermentans subsp. afermentans]|uniref:Uncharacterized protein n=1 Tax=Corynebacterium afermentans TaxID=38286 RepID=A0A9X8WH59_9CORY|nr:hypothetical protein [Corynebacterium afermentans]OAA15873.1 hypothetical protein Caferm_04255 [Corynebacterium afermentans subsp. afermentans]WJY57476.1 hypothetical protein CAFEA_09535 [Corynebacterium afermentans subsp. afermentans]SIQ10102.1 hypothetical protein SAMN05421802_10657 [Corynebacterium afermentans]
MKRTIRTLAAAAMAGAIAISATPAADAQTDIDPTEVATKIIEARFPAVIVAPNGTYYELINGEYKEAAAAPAGAENAAKVSLADNGDIVATLADGSGETIVLGNEKDLNQAGQNSADSTVTTTPQAPAPEATGEATASATSTSTATTLTVPAGTDTTVSATVDANLGGAGAGSSNGAAGEDNAELSPGAIAGIAAAAIGIPVVIAGVTYFLNQDGETLVGSSERVNQQPTPEEKEKSDQLRAEHADEIAAQQVAAAANRGVEAETGSNTIARTLFALVIASVLGAAAFVAGRRFLV